TSPLTIPEDIDGTVALLRAGAASALGVTAFHHFLWREEDDGAQGINHDKSVRLRRQDMSPQWLETGSIYAFRSADFQTHEHRFFGRVGLYPIPQDRVLEIDVPSDFDLAQARMSETA
ncbi:MAG: transferase, partial [Roseobacter sp.]